MYDQMVKLGGKIFSEFNFEMYFYVLCGILAFVFILCLLFTGGKINKFTAAATKAADAVKNGNEDALNEAIGEMPAHIKQRFEAQQKAGKRAEKFLTYEVCVKRTFKGSPISRTPRAFFAFVNVFAIISFFILSFNANAKTFQIEFAAAFCALIIALAGYVFLCILCFIKRSVCNKAAAAYDALIAAIDENLPERESEVVYVAAPVAADAAPESEEPVKMGERSENLQALIERINNMAETGGSLSEIRVCKMQIKEERQKPENQGLEEQRLISDALAVLISVHNKME